ncbi:MULTISPECIES: DUF2147 domain-containing protein [Bizionia]|uniref:DUF2147 domain-containing protein n=1 Tax=Bizionia algoritergicola TaxID=291187 RepID=A0A5D0QXB2_9FLAO|nr:MULTISPECIES: DUF2147 domain-containing protein [Bizionia]OBX21764.1 hypothetical protein BAA08_11455 [Bizionia sp. APA-3]TYB73425.1 DUF2147 domain-containing protein [Bizionia algoritergicola]
MKYLFLLLITAYSLTNQAQTIVGQWETYDDKTKEKKAVIEIYQTDDKYFAKIVKSFVGEIDALCEKCEEPKKDKPIIGLIIIENIKKNNEDFEGGTILDPETGDVYKCNLKLINKNKLEVRGFIGISIFGRTQYWVRKG